MMDYTFGRIKWALRGIIYVIIPLLFSPAGTGTAGSMSINVTDKGTEITGAGGVSRVGINEGCINGSGIRKTEQRETGPFRGIDVDGAFDVQIEQKGQRSVEITGDDNILPHVVTTVKENTLVITADTSICQKSPLIVKISSDIINKVRSDGANDIIISGISNAAFELSVDGAGDVRVSGKTKQLTAVLSGSGTLEAKDLHAENVRISASGSFDASVYASGKLDASLDGAGDITYYGSPKEVSRNISGAGEIEENQ